MGSFSALGTFKNLLQRALADRTYECSFQYSVPLLTEPVEVCETMEESNFIWQVAKAYLPLVQAHTRKQIELLKESILAEGVREGRTMDEMRAFAQGYDATPTDAPDSRTRALTRLEDGDDDIEASGGSAWSHTYTCSCVHGPTQTVAAVLTELLFDVSAGLECSRLHWLSVLHQKYSAQLSSLQEPIAVSADPPTGLAANSLPPLTFKPSRFKDSWPLAFLTTNCHWQQILVNPPRAGQLPSGEQETSEMPTSQMPTSEMPASEMPTSEMPTSEMSTSEIGRSGPVEPGRYEMVTCGCPAAHACKFRSGGLIKIESRIAKCVRSLESPSLPPIERKLLVQRREWLLFQRSERLSVCIGQALGGLATIVHARVRHALASSPADLQLWAECGFLVGWESLLSTSGKEKHMLGDTWGAIIALQTLRVRFALRHGAPVGKPTLQIDYQSTEEASVSVRQGVNETQTVANATGRTELQEEINRESLEWLAAYARSVADFVLPKPEPAPQLEDVRAPRASCKVRVSTAVASCATKRMSMGGKRASVTKMQPFAKSLKPERAPAALTDLREGSEAGEGSETGAADPTVEADEVALAQSGTLEVFVRSGRSLLAADANGLSDPYVVVTVAQGKTWRTKVVAKTLDPVWNESHKFRGTLAEFAEAPLVLRVMDRDWGAADDPLGELIIDTAPLIEEQHMVFSSRPLDKVPTGELTFEIRWAPSGQLSNDFDATLSRDSRPSSPSTRGIYLGSMAKETLEERRMWQLRLLMAELRTIILSVSDGGGPRRKETRVLTLSALAVRILSGGRIISCKSGKDRTGMSVTAEQVSLLQQWHQCSAAGAQRLLDEMRRDGCRMENTRKNVGKRGYAFNGLQRALLPKGLRAAKDTTIAGLQS